RGAALASLRTPPPWATHKDGIPRVPRTARALLAAPSGGTGSREKWAAITSRPWRAMRCPATGLSNPPLSRSTPRPTTSSPHVFCVDPARFRLILHSANERAALAPNRQAMDRHLGTDDAAGPVGPPAD